MASIILPCWILININKISFTLFHVVCVRKDFCSLVFISLSLPLQNQHSHIKSLVMYWLAVNNSDQILNGLSNEHFS